MSVSGALPRHRQGTKSARFLMLCKHANPVQGSKIVRFCVTSRQAAASAPVGTSPGINRNNSAERHAAR